MKWKDYKFSYRSSTGYTSICWYNLSKRRERTKKDGFKTILNFSRRHNLQVFVTGLKIGILASTTFQLTVGSPPASTCFQKCVESVVWPSIGLSCSAVLCFPIFEDLLYFQSNEVFNSLLLNVNKYFFPELVILLCLHFNSNIITHFNPIFSLACMIAYLPIGIIC